MLYLADLRKADFTGAHLQGAYLARAKLQGATLREAELQGALLHGAELQGAGLNEAQLKGADLLGAHLQGANLRGAQLKGARLAIVLVCGASGIPNLDLAVLPQITPALTNSPPWRDYDKETFGEWRDAIANSVPAGPLRDGVIETLAVLDPTCRKEQEDLLDQGYWERTRSSQPQGKEFWGKRAWFLADLACLEDSAPYVARGLGEILQKDPLQTEQKDPLQTDSQFLDFFLDAGGRKLFTDRLLKGKSDPTACPGVRGFTDTDWANLSKLTLTSP